ncbi:FUSC family protein [Thiotrichales bacterium 19S11-10]|nr:FUSC family protein [Thiotrichales bacterium 19S11-10]
MFDLHQNKLSTKILLSIEMAVVIWLCFLICHFINYQNSMINVIGGLWASIVAVIAIQNIRNITSQVTIIRLVGALIGAAVALIILSFHPSSIWIILPIIFITSLICKFVHFEEGIRLAGLTSVMIIAVGLIAPQTPPLWNALARFIEVLIGLLVVFIVRKVLQLIISTLNKKKSLNS